MIFFVGRIKEDVVVSSSVEESRAAIVVFITVSVLEVETEEAKVDVGSAKLVLSVLENGELKPNVKVEGVTSGSKNPSVVVAESFSLCSFLFFN